MSKPSLNLPPLTGITDRNVQSALQAIATWSRAVAATYVSKEELSLPSGGGSGQRDIVAKPFPSKPLESLTLNSLRSYLNSTGASILASSENLIQTDMADEKGVKIGTSGIVGYNKEGEATFTLDARTGDATFLGTVLGGEIIGTTNVSSAGYIYATGVNDTRDLLLGSNLVRGVIVGEETEGVAATAGLMGLASGANSVGAVGWVSGSGSLGIAGVATGDNGIGVYGAATGAGGKAGQFAGIVDFQQDIIVGTGNPATSNYFYNYTEFHRNILVTDGGQIYWKNMENGETYNIGVDLNKLDTREKEHFTEAANAIYYIAHTLIPALDARIAALGG